MGFNLHFRKVTLAAKYRKCWSSQAQQALGETWEATAWKRGMTETESRKGPGSCLSS